MYCNDGFDMFVGKRREIEDCEMGMGNGVELRVEETIYQKYCWRAGEMSRNEGEEEEELLV